MKKFTFSIVLLSLVFPAMVSANSATALTWLRLQQDSSGLIQGNAPLSDWATIAVSAAGENPAIFGSPSILQAIQNRPVSLSVTTDLERRILALRAAGQSVVAEAGRLITLANSGQLGSVNLLNDDVFGVLALRAAGAGASTVKQSVVFIQSNQNSDGGFSSFVGGGSDVDSTAAALTALVVGSGDAGAITRGFEYLAAQQNGDGGFGVRADSGSNVDSTSWALWAYHTAGRSNTAAEAWLRSTQRSNGSFGAAITTSYAVIALSGRALPIIGSFSAPPPSSSPVPSYSQSIGELGQPSPETPLTPETPLSPDVPLVVGRHAGVSMSSAISNQSPPTTPVGPISVALESATISSAIEPPPQSAPVGAEMSNESRPILIETASVSALSPSSMVSGIVDSLAARTADQGYEPDRTVVRRLILALVVVGLADLIVLIIGLVRWLMQPITSKRW